MLAVIFLATSAGLGGLIAASTPASAQSSCETVRHDAFMTDAAEQEVNETGNATSTVQNTEVRVEDATGFIRIRGDNPNGYCVEYTVEIGSDIVAPADLGTVESNDGTTTANWRAAQNLSSGEVFTRVTFELGAGENATWAPSSARVQSLAWTGQARETGGDLFGTITAFFDSDGLEKRHYKITPENASRITVPLTSKNGTQIEDWQATYTFNGETRTLTQNADAPVYYTETEDSVTIHFNDRAVEQGAVVDWTANPTVVDEASYSWTSYWSGADAVSSWLPLVLEPPMEVVA